jgi:hypothetical protein
MNCQMFSDLAGDIARDQMMDAGARTQALAHASECPNCADRLKAEQRLTADLRELVSATKDLTASAAVWEALSASFDARGVAQVTTSRRRWIYAAGAIAAMLLLMFALLPVMRRHRQPANVEASNATNSTAVRAIQTAKETGAEPRHDDLAVSIKQKPQVISRRHLPVRQTSAPQVSQPKEIATDFIPLTYGDPNVGSDAQMVRVELPRSAMASFGLPVNMDRADQRVKADVLLGSDGLARAIRFVQ